MIKNSRVERRPDTGFLAAGFEPVVRPGVASVKEVITSDGFIKSGSALKVSDRQVDEDHLGHGRTPLQVSAQGRWGRPRSDMALRIF